MPKWRGLTYITVRNTKLATLAITSLSECNSPVKTIAKQEEEVASGNNGSEVFDETAECVAMARIGCDDQVWSLATHCGFFWFFWFFRNIHISLQGNDNTIRCHECFPYVSVASAKRYQIFHSLFEHVRACSFTWCARFSSVWWLSLSSDSVGILPTANSILQFFWLFKELRREYTFVRGWKTL